MSYATASQMLIWHGARELVETATPDDVMVVTGELMRLTINGDNRSDFTDEEIAAADLTLERLQAALDDAKSLMDAYLVRRYSLPLTAGSSSPLPRICGTIARFLLQEDQATPTVKEGYERSLKWLTLVSEGKVVLGGENLSIGAGNAMSLTGERVFDDNTLKDFV